jgi:hypothetical protein
MRIRVSGRIIALAILAAVLCFLPASTHVAQARPIGWDAPLDPTPSGDSDGVVLKSASFHTNVGTKAPTSTGNTATSTTQMTVWNTDRHVWKGLRELFAGMRMEYFWLFWVR